MPGVMRVLAAMASLALLVGATGCGGHKGHGIVKITVAGGPWGMVEAVADADASQAPLTSVAPLILKVFPANPKQPATCGGDASVTVSFANGRTLRYGPCRLPEQIVWLARAIEGEAGRWSSEPVEQTRIVGAQTPERLILEQIVAAMKPTRISTIRVISMPDWNAIRLTVTAGETTRGKWEAAILECRYAALALREHLRRVFGLTIGNGYLGNCTNSLGRAPVDLGRVRRVLDDASVRIVELRNVAGAVAVTVQTRRPAEFLVGSGRSLLESLPRPLAGWYFGVEDSHGSIVYAASAAPQVGSWSARIDLAGCGPHHSLGGVRFGRSSYHDPPCPA